MRFRVSEISTAICSRLLVFCFAVLTSIPCPAQPCVEVSAEIELIGYRGTETNGAANTTPRIISVVCITGTNSWWIQDDWVMNSLTTSHFDGTNVYRTSRLKSQIPQAKLEQISKTTRFAQVPFEVARSNLTINVWPSRDGHPLGMPPANIAWLAFCSGTYLKSHDRLVPLPVDDLHHTRDRFAYTDKTITFDDALGLPRAVDLYLSRSLFLKSEADFDREIGFGNRYTEWTKETAQKLEEGVHLFHYEVTESTNFLGSQFPTRFEFCQSGRKFEQNGDWFWRGTGRVMSLRPSSAPKGVFDTSMQQTIVDCRFRDPSSAAVAVVYTSTNAFLSPTNDAALQEKFARQVAEADRMRNN
jgi:hypothetical protein